MEERIRLMLELMNEYDKILDIGCGNGRYTIKFAKHSKETIGIDLIKSRINYARSRKFKNVKFEIMNALKTDFKEKTFDCIIAADLLEHVKNPNSLLKEVKRILRYNGDFIFSTPNGNRVTSLLRKFIGRERKFPIKVGFMMPDKLQTHGDYHYNEFSYDKLKELLNKNGFRIEKVYGVPIFYRYGGKWLGREFPKLSSVFVIKTKNI